MDGGDQGAGRPGSGGGGGGDGATVDVRGGKLAPGSESSNVPLLPREACGRLRACERGFSTGSSGAQGFCEEPTSGMGVDGTCHPLSMQNLEKLRLPSLLCR